MKIELSAKSLRTITNELKEITPVPNVEEQEPHEYSANTFGYALIQVIDRLATAMEVDQKRRNDEEMARWMRMQTAYATIGPWYARDDLGLDPLININEGVFTNSQTTVDRIEGQIRDEADKPLGWKMFKSYGGC